MKAGFGQADITPRRPMPLCGFASRCDADFTGVDDPLSVRVIAVECGSVTAAVIAFDLLALGVEIHRRLLAALNAVGRETGKAVEWVLCATHTHSAPAAIRLLGCGTLQPDYLDRLIPDTVAAARQALCSLRPATLRWTTAEIEGVHYNRRSVLADGRVSMTRNPDMPVRKRGPTWARMVLARFDGDDGSGIAGLASWPAHAVTVCGPHVTADFPGELCRRLSRRHGLPFLFLQGACGNLNPLFKAMVHEEMTANTERIMAQLSGAAWPAKPSETRPCSFRTQTVELRYAPLPSADALSSMQKGMAAIAESGQGSEDMITILADILNVEPGKRPERRMAMHIASVLCRWCQGVIPRAARGETGACELQTAVLRLGKLVFCFVAAEPFVETATALQAASPADMVTLVGYKSPLVGYLPTDDALEEGGYEVEYAYRFYNHPAVFAAGSEGKVVQTLRRMMKP